MNIMKKLVAIVTALTLSVTMAPGIAQGLTAEELQVQINALLAQLQQLQTQLAALEGVAPSAVGVPTACTDITFTKNLTIGSTGADVKCLQALLNTDSATQVATTGAGSPGNETTYFGSRTRAAVVKFQVKYAAEILTPLGLTTGTGFVGSATRAKLNSLLTAVTLPPGVVCGNGVCETGETTANCPADCPAVAPGLTVALAPDTPAAATLVSDATNGSQALAPMVKLTFSNGTAAEVKVTTLKLTRTGIAADADLANVYLYDGATRLAEMTSVAERVYSFVDATGLFSIPANSTKSILVSADVANINLSGKTIALGIAAATDIVADALTFTGTFPLNGNMMSTASVSDVGRLAVDTTVISAPASVDPGITGREILRFNMYASNQNLSVSYIKFTNVGTIANTDLANLKLMDGTTQLGSTLTSLATDNTAVFDLNAAPLAITAGATKNLTVVADVVGGTARNFKLTVQRQSDIIVRDTSYGIYVKPYTHAIDEIFGIIQPAAATTINVGTLAITLDAASPTGNVALNSTNIELARFKFVASGEAVRVLTLPVTITVTGGKNLKNVKLVLDGTQVGATQNVSGTGVTTFTFPASGDFGNSFIIPAGTTGKILSIRADISVLSGTALADADTIVASLTAGSSNAQGQVSLTSLSTGATTGRLLTAATGALTASKNLTVANGSATNPNAVKGATGAKIGSFILTAGAGEGVSVSQIQLQDSVASTTVASTTHDAITNTTGISVTVATNAPFVVGESYYVSLDSAPTTNNATITVTGKTGTTVLTVTGSNLVGTIDANTSITIRSAAGATDTLADTFQNLKLMMGATQIGTTVTSLTDTAGTVYTFTPAVAISIAAGQQVVFDVLADVKSTATTLSVNSDTNGIITHTLTTATGLVTGASANTSGASNTLTLQNVYIAGVGVLAVAVSPDTPITQQVVMGATGQELAKFKFTETSNGEAVNITRIVVQNTVSSETHGSVQNIQLLDGTAVLGTVVSLTRTAATTGTATFSGLNVSVPKGGSKTLTVRADITPYPGATSDSTHKLKVASFVATGASSGASVGTAASGNASTMTVYATKLSVARDATSPTGLSAKSSELTAAIFRVSNSANVGDFDATLRDLAITVEASGTWTAVNDATAINVYKNSVATANLLGYAGSSTWTPASVAFAGWTGGDSDPTNSLANVTISPGTSILLIVTVNTTGAPTAGTLTISIPSINGMRWTDEVTTDIVAVDTLPVSGNTLSF